MTTTKLLNTELFEEIIKHILEEPKRLRMNVWIRRAAKGINALKDFRHFFGVGREHKLPECGTVACFAGWACILSGKFGEKYRSQDYGVEELAKRLLIPDDPNLDINLINRARASLGFNLFRYHPTGTVGTRQYAKAVAQKAREWMDAWELSTIQK